MTSRKEEIGIGAGSRDASVGKETSIRFEGARIEYSDHYRDDKYEYRHVILPHETAEERQFIRELAEMHRFLSEAEWRAIGLAMSFGWSHYGSFGGEPHVLLFRRVPLQSQ